MPNGTAKKQFGYRPRAALWMKTGPQRFREGGGWFQFGSRLVLKLFNTTSTRWVRRMVLDPFSCQGRPRVDCVYVLRRVGAMSKNHKNKIIPGPNRSKINEMDPWGAPGTSGGIGARVREGGGPQSGLAPAGLRMKRNEETRIGLWGLPRRGPVARRIFKVFKVDYVSESFHKHPQG